MPGEIVHYNSGPVENFFRCWPNSSTGRRCLNNCLGLAYVSMFNFPALAVLVVAGRLLDSTWEYSSTHAKKDKLRHLSNAVALAMLFFTPYDSRAVVALFCDFVAEASYARRIWTEVNPPVDHSVTTGLEDYDPKTVEGARFRLGYPPEEALTPQVIWSQYTSKMQYYDKRLALPTCSRPIAAVYHKVKLEAGVSRDTLLAACPKTSA